MAFCFKRKESVSKGIRRLIRERVEDATECLKDCAHGEQVHCARKDIKKVRAVLRLVRTEIERKTFKLLARPLKRAAERLAGPRDAFVRVKTIRSLVSHFKGQLSRGALRHIRMELGHSLRSEIAQFAKEKTVNCVQRELHQVMKATARIGIKAKGWKVLGPGLKSSYDKGKIAYQIVLKDSCPGNLHEWRKSVKDLWYQVTLLRRVWPEQINAITAELDLLGEFLGDYHDLVMLRQAVQQTCIGKEHSSETETLNGLIAERHRELRAAALALGGRFYTEKPAAFCSRLATYWKTWRKEEKAITRLAESVRT